MAVEGEINSYRSTIKYPALLAFYPNISYKVREVTGSDKGLLAKDYSEIIECIELFAYKQSCYKLMNI